MKIKLNYIYIFIIGIGIAYLTYTVLVQRNNSKTTMSVENSIPQDEVHRSAQAQRDKGEMPNDDAHKGVSSQGKDVPSKANVSQEFKHMLETMKKSVEDNPNDTVKIKEYADFLAMAHKQNDAIIWYEKILEKDSKRTDVWFALSYIYHSEQNLVKSEECNQKILAYDKNNSLAKYNLGAISATKGDYIKAKQLWNDLLSTSKDSEIISMTKESLKQLQN